MGPPLFSARDDRCCFRGRHNACCDAGRDACGLLDARLPLAFLVKILGMKNEVTLLEQSPLCKKDDVDNFVVAGIPFFAFWGCGPDCLGTLCARMIFYGEGCALRVGVLGRLLRL